MKISKKLLPIKGHYFFFLASTSPVLPFLMVISKQLGIPVVVHGVVGAIILLFTVTVKPLIAAAADAFPRGRKSIFISLLFFMVAFFFGVYFLPPMHGFHDIRIQGSIVTGMNETEFSPQSNSTPELPGQDLNKIVFEFDAGTCYPKEVWDCTVPNSEDQKNWKVDHIKLLDSKDFDDFDFIAQNRSRLYYFMKSSQVSWASETQNISLQCKGGLFEGETCQPLWSNPFFYAYLFFLLSAYICFNSAVSVSDAICTDIIGEKGNYGSQRLWGTVGWGLAAPISGLLIDWWSGDDFGKNYAPAFIIMAVLGCIDIFLCASKLKVPRISSEKSLMKSVWPVLKRPQFLVFLFFVIMAGSFDGVVASYIFVLQEDMARETNMYLYMKLIQGLTLFVQCFFEAPFMFICDWCLKLMGSSNLFSLVFFLYIFRLFALAIVGTYKIVWATLLTEILNGPCYGLGYTAIVVQAGLIAPPGTSATVQSITNIFYESFGYGLASFLGGILYEQLGGPGIYYTFGSISFCTFVLHLISVKWEKNIKGNVDVEVKNVEESELPQPEESLLNAAKNEDNVNSFYPELPE